MKRLLLVAASLVAPLAAQHDDPDPNLRKPLPSPAEIAALPKDGGEEFNRLIFEQSPYLLQHARNPVDWYPWGEEAFRAAKAQNKPVLLSIGYSTCHWCHVMEHESFEDQDVATLLKEGYIAIKLDREERPDLDHIYMTVTQAMTGSGGWPMTVIMTPDKQPFFAGTYFPKHGRGGRPGFVDILQQVSNLWQTDAERAGLVAHAAKVTNALVDLVKGNPGELDESVLDRAYLGLLQRHDSIKGGFSDRPKFPVPHNLRFLLRHHLRSGEANALKMVELTLTEMRKGGIWDHVGHGFHRYSTDRDWLVPHFEKMLYDQALLAMAYLDAYQVTGKQQYARTAREILTYVARDMTSPEGGFYSAEDADSEGEEGLFYLWTREELEEALEEDDAAWAVHLFQVTDEGNFVDESTRQRNGRNILHLKGTHAELAKAHGLELAAFEARLEGIRARLFEVREPRIHPLKDDKILTDWNGLMIAAFAQAARVLDDDEYRAVTRRAVEHLHEVLLQENGQLYKLARLGVPAGDGMLEDYAFVIWGLLESFESLQNPRDLATARALASQMIARFADEERGGFYLSPVDGEALIVRPKEIYDGAIPSGNSVAAWVLLRLGRLTGETDLEERAAKILTAFAGDVNRQPGIYTQLLFAVDFGSGSNEIVVVGDPAAEDTRAMLAAIHGVFAPNKVVILKPIEGARAIEALVPYLKDQGQVGGKATAYVCEDFACQAPTNDPEAVRAALGGKER
ncbi:MAG: thioredoxin domain-containing protein [Planctomycetota bacterium]|nr:thioredoxin domain-containing protein [Planctomycetota bacterium]